MKKFSQFFLLKILDPFVYVLGLILEQYLTIFNAILPFQKS